MCEQTKRYFSPRLVDYVIIVGCRHPNKSNAVIQTPELLRRYPLEDHKDFALPPDIIFFCQPEGCINTGHQRTGFQQITSFVFTLTEKDSNRQRFGICVNFYRHFSRRTTCSVHNHNQTKTDRTDSSDDNTDSTTNYLSNLHEYLANETTDNTTNERKRKRRLRNNTLTSICLISHHPFFTRFRECIMTLKTIVDACNERSCAKRTGASRGTSRETVWSVLTGQACECTSNLVGREVREIETWILRLLSAPVCIPGKTKVLIQTLPNEQPMLFALPDHTRFSLVDFPLHLPLELLGVDLCIRILTLIMLENKVVFQSRDYNALTMSVLAFVALLYPLEYMFPVIPLLPTCMTGAEQLLLIPTPFIIGVPASFFPYKGMGSKKFDDIWIIDLDLNKIIPPRHAEPFFDIPEYEYSVLSNHLKQTLASISSDLVPIENLDVVLNKKSPLPSPMTRPARNVNTFIFGNDVDSVDVATRVAMVRFFNSANILGNFNEHTRTLRLHPRAVVAFQYTSFIRSRPVKSSFIIRLAKTQAVEFFAEWSLCPDNVAFQRVHTGIYDPDLIGDKPKWYSRHLTAVPFSIIEENNTLGQAVHSLNAKSDDAEQTPTDESGSDSEDGDNEEDDQNDSPSSCYSSLSDFVSEMRNSEICGEIRENKIYPENQEQTACVEYSTVFSPPNQLQIPESQQTTSNPSMSESTISSSSNSQLNSPSEEHPRRLPDLSNTILEIDSKSSSATITPVTKTFPKPLFEPKTIPNDEQMKISDLKSESSRPSTPLSTRSPSSPYPKANLKIDKNKLIRHGDSTIEKIIANRTQDFIRQQGVELKANTHNENQQFLKEIVQNVLDGQGVGWLKISRVKKLMEDENYRNYVLSRLNNNLDKRYADEDDHIDDVKITQMAFRGMTDILRAVIQGLEATFDNNGVGGMASTFQLLEIAHTHYWVKDNTLRNDLSPMSERTSPISGSRESLAPTDSMTASTLNSMSLSLNLQSAVKQVTLASPTAAFVAQLGSFFRESKSAIARGYASATQATMDYVDQQRAMHQSLIISPTFPANLNSNTDKQPQAHMSQSMIEQRTDSFDLIGDEFQNIEISTDQVQISTVHIKKTDALDSQTSTTRINISRVNSNATDDESIADSIVSSRRQSKSRRLSAISTMKSSFSIGYRFRNGSLMQMADNNSVILSDKQYLFEVLVGTSRSPLWDQMQIWEDIFLDAVAQERDIIGLDQGPAEMMERYYSLSSSDRKRLELDEDRLLAVMLYNFTAFMIMMRVNKDEIRRKIRRMLGRCHIGLTMSQQVNELIDNISNLNGNDVDLRPVRSRLMQKQTFTVHWGTDNTGDVIFMEVWDDCLIFRSVFGEVMDRCWFEKVVNMTYCPKTKVVCLWRKGDGETQLNKFYTKRCRILYLAIKEAMEKAAKRMRGSISGQELGGEFPIKNVITGEGGLIQVCLEGICLTFENHKEFIELQRIRKCTTQKGDLFVLEEFDPESKQMTARKYKSSMANEILLAFHRILSVLLEHQCRKKSKS